MRAPSGPPEGPGRAFTASWETAPPERCICEILKLGNCMPLIDIGENDTFELTSEGSVVWNQIASPPLRSR
jgi:hypothetical protein